MKVTTTSGSVYSVSFAAKTWGRIKHGHLSGVLRTEFGVYHEISKIEVGKRMRMICPPYGQDGIKRGITTGIVVSIEAD